MVFSKRTCTLAVVLYLGVGAGGCGDSAAGSSPVDSGVGGSSDGGGHAGGAEMVSASKGGQVTEGSISVDIPAGALSKDTKITAKVVDSSKLPDAKLLVGDVYDLGPNGTRFSKPVTLTFDIGSAKFATGEVPMLAFLEKDSWQLLDDSELKDGKVTATTTHFTFFGVVRHRTMVDKPIEDAGPGADAGGGGGGTTMSCERGSSADQTMHSCGHDTFSITLGQDLVDRMKEGCTQSGGKVVASCDLAGAVGGCRMIMDSGAFTRTSTIWHYYGDAAGEEKNCASLNENNEPGDPEWMFVAPE